MIMIEIFFKLKSEYNFYFIRIIGLADSFLILFKIFLITVL